MTQCVKCGRSLPAQDGAGRPAKWCSVGCRRAAEHEVRRLARRLERLEDQLPTWRRAVESGRHPTGGSRDHARAKLADLEAFRDEAEARLRLLLDEAES